MRGGSQLDGNSISINRLEEIPGADLLASSAKWNWPNLLVCTTRIGPFSKSFLSNRSLLVSMVTSGSLCGRWKIGSEYADLNLRPGTIFIIPPHISFAVEVISNAELINIYINSSLLEQVIEEYSSMADSTFNIRSNLFVVDEFMEQSVLSIKEILHNGGTFSGVEAQYFARVLVGRIITRYSSPASKEQAVENGLPPGVVQKTIEFINLNLHKRIANEQLADLAGVGAAQFGRLFKRTMDMTPHQYIIRSRIERARTLLTETDMPIVEIAQECGFADQVHLTRFFGRIMGTSPASFRRKSKSARR